MFVPTSSDDESYNSDRDRLTGDRTVTRETDCFSIRFNLSFAFLIPGSALGIVVFYSHKITVYTLADENIRHFAILMPCTSHDLST